MGDTEHIVRVTTGKVPGKLGSFGCMALALLAAFALAVAAIYLQTRMGG
ncbi:MAG TPA: hypothetical protein VJU16_09150 [Planctomycetota bacterium]|nr:hypothetical protein [Planctomycetota bacterium]